jgi:hypothetical protein
MAKSPTDIFMQFAAWKMTWPGTSTDLTEVKKQTGLSVRGGLMWLIHLVELTGFIKPPVVTDVMVTAALSTIAGAAAAPTPADKGYVAGFTSVSTFLTSGMMQSLYPWVQHFLPPVPIAAPSLSAYIHSSADNSSLDGKDVHIRAGYTTTPLDAKAYAEIAETWSYV